MSFKLFPALINAQFLSCGSVGYISTFFFLSLSEHDRTKMRFVTDVAFLHKISIVALNGTLTNRKTGERALFELIIVKILSR